MTPEEIRAFAARDWASVASAKETHWRQRKVRQTAADMLADGDLLRRHAQALRPDWPSTLERQEDLAVHLRVAEALRAVAQRRR